MKVLMGNLGTVSISFLFTCLVLVLSSGCATIYGTLPARESPDVSNMLRAGAAKVDITPPAGFPMGGHSVAGKISRGQWLRLKARSLYLESPDGSKLALVAADLWSMPAGLADRASEIIATNAQKGCRLGRDQIIFAATHTSEPWKFFNFITL